MQANVDGDTGQKHSMKLGKKPWLANLIRDLSPTSNGAGKDFAANTTSGKHSLETLTIVVKVFGGMFAMIGLAVCLRWILSSMITLEIVPTSALNQGPTDQNAFTKSLNHHQQPPEECTPNEVITEFSNRLLLLENAFREQVFARETIAKEVNDQTDIYTDLEQKLAEVLQELSNISVNYKLLEAKYKNLSDRIYSDEMLSLLVILMLVLEILYNCRPLIVSMWRKTHAYKHKIKALIPWAKQEQKNSSRPSTPKHGAALRNEICLITLQTNNGYHNIFDAMLRHLDGVKHAVKPHLGLFSADDLKNMPIVRLYVLIVDVDTQPTYCSGSDSDLLAASIKFIRSIRSNIVVILSNEEGSKNLTAHSLYNSSIRLVKTNDFLQDLAANGRLFSMWQELTSHQLSHLRRTIKTVLNLKSVIR